MNLNEMHDALTVRLITSEDSVPGGNGMQLYDVMVKADSCEYELDLADTWLTPSRWNTLTRQYLEGNAHDQWLDQISDRLSGPKSHGVSFMRTNSVTPRTTTKGAVTRRWGSCMIGYSFRRYPTPTLVMYSRSTYLGYIGRLDLGVAAKLAQEISRETGIPVSEISFTWYLQQATFHSLRSLPWWYTNDLGKSMLVEKGSPFKAVRDAQKHLLRFIRQDKAGMLYGDEKYATHRVFRMKWHQSTKPEGWGDRFLGEGMIADITTYPRIIHTVLDDLPLLMNYGMEMVEDDEGDEE